MNNNKENLYDILQSDKNATLEDLKKNYQRLIMCTHPDKTQNEDCSYFSKVRNAWTVLSNPESRRLYDASIVCNHHEDDFVFVSLNVSEMNYDKDKGEYSYSCRCGGTYVIKEKELTYFNIMLPCNECSFSIEIKR